VSAALSQPTTITITIVGLFAFFAILALLRVVLRKEPNPASWRRYRLGVFLERDPIELEDEDVIQSAQPFEGDR